MRRWVKYTKKSVCAGEAKYVCAGEAPSVIAGAANLLQYPEAINEEWCMAGCPWVHAPIVLDVSLGLGK